MKTLVQVIMLPNCYNYKLIQLNFKFGGKNKAKTWQNVPSKKTTYIKTRKLHIVCQICIKCLSIDNIFTYS